MAKIALADGGRMCGEQFGDAHQHMLVPDPGYAVAYAGLADAYNMISFRNVMAPHAVMPKARAAAANALELDANRAEPHVSLAYASFTYDRDWPAAGRHFERAQALNPAYVMGHAFYPLYLSSRGRSEESISVAKRALESARPAGRIDQEHAAGGDVAT